MEQQASKDPWRVPFVRQRWEDVTFFHWRHAPSDLQPLVPDGVELEVIDGSAWVSLLLFAMEDLRPAGLPPLPRLSSFPETNLRTYVVLPDGRATVHFFSLDAASPLTLTARPLLGLPYVWSTMVMARHGDQLTYTCARRHQPEVGHHVVIRRGQSLTSQGSPLERALADRWGARVRVGTRQAVLPVVHPRWQLMTAEVERFEENLVQAAGVPASGEAPLVRYSPGVSVTFGLPRFR